MKKLLLSSGFFLLAIFICSAQTFKVDTLIYNGAPSNRINLLIMGDGYTTAQMPLFKTNATSVANYLLNASPFNQYKSFFNVFAIEVISNESGTNHPGTATDEASSGGQPITSVDNYLNSTFDYGGTHRCIYSASSSTIFSIANTNFPQYDYINVIVNTSYYGGCGGSYTFTSMNSSSPEIFVHEFGHTFGNLSDEYDYGSTNCTAGTVQNINVSQVTNVNTLVWRNWLTTALIPTPEGTSCGLIGLYQGAKYCTTNWYRPKCNCKMRALSQPFCEVCKEQFVYKISTLVNYIEGYAPANLNPTVCRNTTQLFTTNILNSLNNTVRVQWFVDNILVSNNTTSFSFNPNGYTTGTHQLKVVAYDTTAVSKKTMTSYSVTWNIKIPSLLSSTHTQTNVTCNGGSNGSATIIPSGTTLPYLYHWSTGSASPTLNNIPAGTYTVTVTDNAGCKDSAVITITQPVPVAANISPAGPTTFCEGQSVVLNANSASSYLWSNGATTQNITAAASGDYIVTVKDATGCSGTSAPVTVTVNPLPSAIITPAGATSFCLGDSVILSSSAGNNYLWSNSSTSQNITLLSPGSFSVRVTDVHGCSAVSTPIQVVVDTVIHAMITAAGPTTFCSGNSVTLTANSRGLWSTGVTAQSITVSDAGIYTLILSNTCGADTSSQITVIVKTLPLASVTANSATTFCNGDSVTLTATLANAYLWSNGDTSQSVTVSTTGNYSVTVTDSNSCSSTSTITHVAVNTPQNGAAITVRNDTLFSPYPQFTQWYFEGNLVDSGTFHACGQTGKYVVSGIDANGCAATSDTLFVNCAATGITSFTSSSAFQVFPNPATGNFNIIYSLQKETQVSIKLFDGIGNLVTSILDKKLQSGKNSTVIETSSLSSGMYFIEVKLDSEIVSNKIVLIK
ncbi:MAG: peptidase protein [Bacteroidota bacterium]|nr:peptidase protein [Bacteroidota bacterium]